MAKTRVHDLAKEYGMSSKEMLGHLRDMKIPAKSASSTLEDAYVSIVRKRLEPILEARAAEIEAQRLAEAEAQAKAAEEARMRAEAERLAAEERRRKEREEAEAKARAAEEARKPRSGMAALEDQLKDELRRAAGAAQPPSRGAGSKLMNFFKRK